MSDLSNALVGVALSLWSKRDGETVPFPGEVTVVEHQRSEPAYDDSQVLHLIVRTGGELYRIDGLMDSYGDFSFDEAKKVTAREKTVTVYE